MLRRVTAATTPKTTTKSTTTTTTSTWNRRRKGGGGGLNTTASTKIIPVDIVVCILVLAAVVITIAAYLWIPIVVQQQHQSSSGASSSPDFTHLWENFHDIHGNRPPIPHHEHPQLKNNNMNDNTGLRPPPTKSKITGVSWVEGEQLLKQELQKLAVHQAAGRYLGVPVLTRWVGADIPAWPSVVDNDKDDTTKKMSPEEWQTQVEARYAAMRQEEIEWQQTMTQYLQQQYQHRG